MVRATRLSLIFNRLSAFLLAAPACAQDILTGPAEVIDADILRIGNQRVILWGIDAPERGQRCARDGEDWGCYDAARRTLELLAGRGDVTCVLTGEPDPFNRRHGVCESGGEDLAAEMVRRGMALAYKEQAEDYMAPQAEAIAAEEGVWAIGVEMQAPWDFRRESTPGGYR